MASAPGILLDMDQTDVRIRPVREEDRPDVLALAPRLAEGVAAWRDHDAAVRAAERWLTASIDGEGAVFVAEKGGRVVGVVSVDRQWHFTGAEDAYVGELAVHPDSVRTGVGRRLLAAAEDWARDQGLRHLTLETGAADTTARRFYAALGYQEESVRLTRPLTPGNPSSPDPGTAL
ncbi:MAG: GNAT family N-acetyltransferase [Nonomuraea sp.]|nr:GNAT family N-acetyltransferase [Nonomuraea sp.]NUP79223.1 GNAT family N-acetyltransferase [Nonomuraea sp.]